MGGAVGGGVVGGGAVGGGVRDGGVRKKTIRLKDVDPPMFSGKAKDYARFKERFEEMVVSSFDEMGQLEFLEKALSKPVKDRLSMLSKTCDQIWDQLDILYNDPKIIVHEAVKELHSLDHKVLGKAFMIKFSNMLEDTEVLLDLKGHGDYLRHPLEVNVLQGMLPEKEQLEYVKREKDYGGTDFNKIKTYLADRKREEESLRRMGLVKDGEEEAKCNYCGLAKHVEADCRKKKRDKEKNPKDAEKKTGSEGTGKECWNCGESGHISAKCPKEKKDKKTGKHFVASNHVRPFDCPRCKGIEKQTGKCGGCGKSGAALKHCLAHCPDYMAENVNGKADMVKKVSGCVICLHPGHQADACYNKDNDKRLCGVDSCGSHHHPSLHGARDPIIANCRMVVYKGEVTESSSSDDTFSNSSVVPFNTSSEYNTSSSLGLDKGLQSSDATFSESTVAPTEEISREGEEVDSEATKSEADLSKGKFGGKWNPKKYASNFVQCFSTSTVEEGQEKEREFIMSWSRERRERELKEIKRKLGEPMPGADKVLCIIIKVDFIYGERRMKSDMIALFDPGSNTSLVLLSLAKHFKFIGRPVTIKLDTVTGPEIKDTFLELLNRRGERRIIKAYGVDRISDVITEVDFGNAKEKFSKDVRMFWKEITSRPHGKPIQLLVGSEKAAFMPTRVETADNLVVLNTEFGAGWGIYGYDEAISSVQPEFSAEVQCIRRSGLKAVPVSINQIKLSTESDPPATPVKKVRFVDEDVSIEEKATVYRNGVEDLTFAEDMGVEPPRRCPDCKGCSLCSFRGQMHSQQETLEYQLMEQGIVYDEELKKFRASYPWIGDPKTLSNNPGQAIKIAESEERKLKKEGLMDQFNDVVRDTLKLGYIEELEQSEMDAWTGPVHYVSWQHVVKQSSATTKIRIVVNSSLKCPRRGFL